MLWCCLQVIFCYLFWCCLLPKVFSLNHFYLALLSNFCVCLQASLLALVLSAFKGNAFTISFFPLLSSICFLSLILKFSISMFVYFSSNFLGWFQGWIFYPFRGVIESSLECKELAAVIDFPLNFFWRCLLLSCALLVPFLLIASFTDSELHLSLWF
jgi:hypothetical protein